MATFLQWWQSWSLQQGAYGPQNPEHLLTNWSFAKKKKKEKKNLPALDLEL